MENVNSMSQNAAGQWVPKYRTATSTFRFETKRNGKIVRAHKGLTEDECNAEVKQAIADGFKTARPGAACCFGFGSEGDTYSWLAA